MFLEPQLAWCRDHFLGEPVPGPDHPLGEEPFTNIQSEFPVAAPCRSPWSCHWSPESTDQRRLLLFSPS